MKKSIRTILYAFLFAALLPSVPRAEAALTLSELDPGTEAAAVLGYADGFIELYNAGGEDACTEGWSVSDRADERKYALPAAAVPAGGYLAVSLSEAGFRAGARESVYLFDPEGAVAGSLSCGDGGFSVSPGGVLRFPSPGRRNGTAYKTAAEVPAFEERGLSISEVSGAGGDWAELYNGTLTEIGLRGCRLWIEGKEYPLSGEIHAGGYLAAENVTVPASGCTVYLLGPGGDILDAFSTGALKYGQSSGRVNGARRFFDTPTKGAANGAGFAAYAPVPVFSDTALYHEAPFSLTLEAGGALIRYTLDGSAVTEDSPVYAEPLWIEDSVTVRARAYGEDRLPGDEAAFTYLFTEKHTVPAVCLSMAPRDFKQVYGAEERSEVTERAALCTVYDTDGLVSAAFPCGVKAKGRGSLVFAQKSLTVKLRAKYGQKGAALPYFGTDPVYSFCLRAGGQDIRNAVFRDTLIQRAAAHTHADTVKTVPAVLYVNGAYYGLFMLQEEMNADYYVSHYGVEKEDLDVINQDAGVRQGTLEAYTALRRLARKYTESGKGFEDLAAAIDADAYTDYAAIQIITGNSDVLNQKVVHARSGAFPWRPMLFDEDSAFGAPKTDLMRAYFKSGGFTPSSGKKVLCNNDVFKALYRNKTWRKAFARRTVELLCTDFSEERLNALIDELVREFSPEMPREIERYGFHKDMADWEAAVGRLRDVVAVRKATVYGQLKSYCGVSDDELAAWEKEFSAQ